MVAFRLGQTLSEHGSVSRGVCLRGADGLLTGIREHTKISRHADGTLWDEPPGGEAIALTGEEPVSMNCWGFQPALFEELERSFAEFLRGVGDEVCLLYTSFNYTPFGIVHPLTPLKEKGFCSVSYTHLDVYKRQNQWFQ